jgi:signal transduction histidine kinase
MCGVSVAWKEGQELITEVTNSQRRFGNSRGKWNNRDGNCGVRGSRVLDEGKGMPEGTSEDRCGPRLGVGIQGMRERVRQLGGHLEIRSEKTGTVVFVSLPLTSKSVAAREGLPS